MTNLISYYVISFCHNSNKFELSLESEVRPDDGAVFDGDSNVWIDFNNLDVEAKKKDLWGLKQLNKMIESYKLLKEVYVDCRNGDGELSYATWQKVIRFF